MVGLPTVRGRSVAGSYTTFFFHFRHHPVIEGLIQCDISTKGELSSAQITAIKYNAQKESQAHIRLKGIIRDSLIADRSCGEPLVEKVWTGQPVADRATWRKPDVQVVRGNDRIAFEVQLSTTFLLRSSTPGVLQS